MNSVERLERLQQTLRRVHFTCHADRLCAAGNVLVGEHRDDARRSQCALLIDAADGRVRADAAHEHRFQRAGDLDVGEVPSLALEEPLVFDAGNGLADPVVHAPSLISVVTLRTRGPAKALLNEPIAIMSISRGLGSTAGTHRWLKGNDTTNRGRPKAYAEKVGRQFLSLGVAEQHRLLC